MSTNPIFDFYLKLEEFVSSSMFGEISADEIATLALEINPTFFVTYHCLEDLYKELSNDDLDDPNSDSLREIVADCFRDLASQMRNEPVRDLFKRWKDRAGIPNDLFIFHRKMKDLGDSIAVSTIVYDDVGLFRLFNRDPEKFLKSGRVHYLESGDVMDPDTGFIQGLIDNIDR